MAKKALLITGSSSKFLVALNLIFLKKNMIYIFCKILHLKKKIIIAMKI